MYIHLCTYMYIFKCRINTNVKILLQYGKYSMILFGEKFRYIAIYSSFLEFVPCNRFTRMDTLSQ